MIGTAPRIEDIGKYYEMDATTPFCTINEPGRLRVCLPVVTPELNLSSKRTWKQPTSAAKPARRRLKTKVSVDYSNAKRERNAERPDDEIEGRHVRAWSCPAARRGSARDVPGQRVTIVDVLNQTLDSLGMGYFVVSDDKNARDGVVLLLTRPGTRPGWRAMFPRSTHR